MADATQATATGLRHAAMPYRSTRELAAAIAAFVPAGDRAADPVLVACPRGKMRSLRQRLDILADRVLWADMYGLGRNPGRLISAIQEFAAQRPGRTTWCVQEPAWPARSAAELREVIRHEALLNLALAASPVSVMCPYDVRLGAELIAAAERTHPIVVRDGRWLASSRYASDKLLPEEFDGPLSPPPADADVLRYQDELAHVRSFVSERARRAGLRRERATDLMLAVAELTANTVAHTNGPGILRMWAADGEVVCHVNDTGVITDPLAGRLRPDDAVGGGFGLWLVNQACDLVELRSGLAGTSVRLHMRLRSRPAR